jgi:hypothetical protein
MEALASLAVLVLVTDNAIIRVVGKNRTKSANNSRSAICDR